MVPKTLPNLQDLPDLKPWRPAPVSRVLGRTGLAVSSLGFGCSAYWARPIFPERQALALVEQAIEGGIRLFDTGPIYGAGLGETRLGRALRSAGTLPGLIVCSKVGTHVGENGRVIRDWSAEAIRTSVRRSLDRLGMDRLQGLHLHGPNVHELRPPLLEALEGLKAEGLVQFIGINSFDPEVIRLGLTLPLFDSFMIEYNLIHKANATLLDEIAASGAAAIIGSPIAQALFRRSFWPTSPKAAWELGRALVRHRADLSAARAYEFLNHLPDMTGAQAALAYVLRSSQVAAAVFATTSPSHLRLNIAAAGMVLPDDLARRIESLPDAHPLSS
jgi:aryl-alcohol dehydrogenase-like predicted oxidoreductase